MAAVGAAFDPKSTFASRVNALRSINTFARTVPPKPAQGRGRVIAELVQQRRVVEAISGGKLCGNAKGLQGHLHLSFDL